MSEPAKIRSLHVVLTAGCNLACSYCYQTAKRPEGMSWDTLRSSLDLLLQSRQEGLQLFFIGGEPLMRLPLIRRAVAYCRRRAGSGGPIQYEIISNGTLLDDRTASFLDRNEFKLHLSFDGVQAAQNLRGRGTFEKLDRLLDRLRERFPALFAERLRIAMTITSFTIPSLAESIRYFLRKGVREISVAPVYTHDPTWKNDQISELDRQFARILQDCQRHYDRTGEVPLMPFRGGLRDTDRPLKGRTMCGANRGETLSVDIDGQVHGCLTFGLSYESVASDFLRDRLQTMRVGDVRSDEFPARLAGFPEAARSTGLFHAKQEKYSSYGRCGDCRFLSSCDVCPTSIGHIPGNTDPNRVSDLLCAWNLVTLEYAEKFRRRNRGRDLLVGRAPLPDLMRMLQDFAETRRAARAEVEP